MLLNYELVNKFNQNRGVDFIFETKIMNHIAIIKVVIHKFGFVTVFRIVLAISEAEK